jgi:CheY-like chemotaxis protein
LFPGASFGPDAWEYPALQGRLPCVASWWSTDDPQTRAAIALWVKPCGFRGAITDGGASGLAALKDANLDMMIVDVFTPKLCSAIEIYLDRHGFEVTIADGGEAGLQALEESCFDLMLVDIFMPHMRGFESIRMFHERAPTIPLVAMSGYASFNLDSPAPDFLRMAIEPGGARCLRKPFTPGALMTVVNECLAEPRSRFNGAVPSN